MHCVHIVWFHHLFILMGEIPQEDVLLKFIHAKDVKNVDIVQMQYIKILLHMQNALIN